MFYINIQVISNAEPLCTLYFCFFFRRKGQSILYAFSLSTSLTPLWEFQFRSIQKQPSTCAGCESSIILLGSSFTHEVSQAVQAVTFQTD